MAAAGTPLSVLAEPTGAVFDVLSWWPATTAAYAMSAFGPRVRLGLHRGCQLEPALPNDWLLQVLMNALCGRWLGTKSGDMTSLTVDGYVPSTMRAVAEYRDGEGAGQPGVRLAMLLTSADGVQDFVSAVG